MAKIQQYLDNIKNALFGREVRGSIHDGIEAINKEVERTTAKQEHLDATFNQLIINEGNSNAEIVAARVNKNNIQFPTLGDRLNIYDSQLENIVINIFNYRNLVTIVNNCEDWKPAFDKAFEDLKDGGIFLMPKHDYYISTRSILQNKKNINIMCAGTIKPIDGQTPIIGTVSFYNLKDCVFNGLEFDGNTENTPTTTLFGSQSLLHFENCNNLIFNNLRIYNTQENGITSNGNVSNIIFNNVYLENIGEHGIYFGGSNCNNIKFLNLICKDIGISNVNDNRFCGVIKLRNKDINDIMHDNLTIDGFEFISTQSNIAGHRQLINAYDLKNLVIKNGKIKGERTSIFASNIALDNFIIENVYLDGLYLFYGLNTYNDSINSLTPGKMNIVLRNSYFSCSHYYISDVAETSNCIFNCKGQITDFMSETTHVKKVIYNNVQFIMNNHYFNIRNINKNFEFNGCKFSSKSDTSPLFDLASVSALEEAKFTFNNCEDVDTHNLFSQSHNRFEIQYINSIIRSEIKTTSKLKTIVVHNCKLLRSKIDTYVESDVFELNGIYDLNGKRYDIFIDTAVCKSHNTNVNLDLRYQIAKNLVLDKLIITNNKGIPFNVTVSNNIVNLSTITTQAEDTVFTVFYNA